MAQPTARETTIIQAIVTLMAKHPGLEGEFVPADLAPPFCGYLHLFGDWGSIKRPLYIAWRITPQQGKLLVFHLQSLREQQPLLLADYVPESLAHQLHQHQINYLDTIGNGYIHAAPFFYEISGRRKKSPKMLPNRSQQLTGTKIIYQLLQEKQLCAQPYRTIAQRANVALGAVGPVIKELLEKNLLGEDVNGHRHLLNPTALRQQWEGGYLARMRPKLAIERCRFSAPWNTDSLPHLIREQKLSDQVLIGGELAAAFYCENVQAQTATLHLDGKLALKQMLQLRLTPSADGPVTIVAQFAANNAFVQRTPEGLQLAEPRLVRCELLYDDSTEVGKFSQLAQRIEHDYLLSDENSA
ncbi:MAG: type IV toxin-antitoxin system AbiEi family antitoxin [Desulfuromonas sp.]|nr:type IV toxin-antitoxin system AbiEi family antitoxin [Desulfuromonas sp.]